MAVRSFCREWWHDRPVVVFRQFVNGSLDRGNPFLTDYSVHRQQRVLRYVLRTSP
jgi:hypothetical protein